MSNFSKAKKYYTKAEMEAKIKELLGKSELRLSEQNTEIAGMRAQIEKQQREIKELKKREKVVRTALISATDQAKIAYEEAKEKRVLDFARLEQLKSKYAESLAEFDKKLSKQFENEFCEILEDLKSGVGAGELARRRELEKARKKVEEANKIVKENQKDLESRYRLVLERYQALTKTESEEFSIEEALNPTASLEEIMKEIFRK